MCSNIMSTLNVLNQLFLYASYAFLSIIVSVKVEKKQLTFRYNEDIIDDLHSIYFTP